MTSARPPDELRDDIDAPRRRANGCRGAAAARARGLHRPGCPVPPRGRVLLPHHRPPAGVCVCACAAAVACSRRVVAACRRCRAGLLQACACARACAGAHAAVCDVRHLCCHVCRLGPRWVRRALRLASRALGVLVACSRRVMALAGCGWPCGWPCGWLPSRFSSHWSQATVTGLESLVTHNCHTQGPTPTPPWGWPCPH